MQRTLEKELSEIPPPSSANRIQHNSLYDSGQGTFSDYYATSLTPPEIRSYYDRELAKRGWAFQQEAKRTNWGDDLGESERPTAKAQYPLTYTLQGSWKRNWVTNTPLD
jgi:hypothetical protein